MLAALNRDAETVPWLNYTSIFSTTDSAVVPPSSDLAGGANVVNIAVQTICPGRAVGHGEAPQDAAVFAIALDALTHRGLASAARIDRAVCAQAAIPVDAAEPAYDADGLFYGSYLSSGPLLLAEPAPAPYALRAPPAAPIATLDVTPHRVVAGRRVTLRVSAQATAADADWPLPGAVVRLAGRHLTTAADGTAHVTLRFARAGRRIAELVAQGAAPVRRSITVREPSDRARRRR
jgi:hypothetical protein